MNKVDLEEAKKFFNNLYIPDGSIPARQWGHDLISEVKQLRSLTEKQNKLADVYDSVERHNGFWNPNLRTQKNELCTEIAKIKKEIKW